MIFISNYTKNSMIYIPDFTEFTLSETGSFLAGDATTNMPNQILKLHTLAQHKLPKLHFVSVCGATQPAGVHI
jgi:hypothetical protein